MRDPITNPSAGDVLLIGQIPGEHGPEGGFERPVAASQPGRGNRREGRMNQRKAETASGGSRTDPSGEATTRATALTEGGPSLFTDQSVPIRSRGSGINKIKKPVRAGQFGLPALPPSSEILTPSRIEALRRRARHAHRNALAFRGIGEIELAAIYQQCADDIAELLGESA
jgi:hypothetical protein